MKISIGIALVVFGLMFDVYSCYLYCNRIINEKGPSGFPLLPFIPQIIGMVLILDAKRWIVGFTTLIFVHIGFQFVVPYLVRMNK